MRGVGRVVGMGVALGDICDFVVLLPCPALDPPLAGLSRSRAEPSKAERGWLASGVRYTRSASQGNQANLRGEQQNSHTPHATQQVSSYLSGICL